MALNNSQYQYFEKSLKIPIPIPKFLKHPNTTQYQYQYLHNFVFFTFYFMVFLMYNKTQLPTYTQYHHQYFERP